MTTKAILLAAGLFAALSSRIGGAETVAGPVPCASGVLVTLESDRIAAVNWVERRDGLVHTRSVLTQSRAIDAMIEVRPDGTAARATTVLEVAGAPPETQSRALGEGGIYWSDMSAVSVEEAILRARRLGGERQRLVVASLFSDRRDEIEVQRIDDSGWVVMAHGKRYEVVSDEQGCLLAAALPGHGVVIERRALFPPEDFPLWPPYGAPPDGAYRAKDVAIRAPQGHVLAGTLTVPARARGRRPAAVLITGLSAHERNNGQPPWMPLRDLADALTRAGMLVLRVDDRGVGRSTGARAPSTTFDEADDVQTQVAWLRARGDVDARRVILVGYSEGGLIATMIVAKDPTIAGVVILAGPGVPGSEVARYQIEAAVVHDPDILPGNREAEIRKQLAEELTPREASYLGIDPLAHARRVRSPALIVQGSTDMHVPLRSAEALASAMRAGGNGDVTVRLIPAVSHSLLPDPEGPNSGWPYLPAFYTAPQILDAVSRWVVAHLRP